MTPTIDRINAKKNLDKAWKNYRRATRAADKCRSEWFSLPLLDERNAKFQATYKRRWETAERHRETWNRMVEEFCR